MRNPFFRRDPAHGVPPPASSRQVSPSSNPPSGHSPQTGQPSDLASWVLKLAPSTDSILQRQAMIHRDMPKLSRSIDSPNFRRVSRDDLVRLVHLIDEAFFESRILRAAKAEGLEFGFSSRMTSNAGKLVTHYAEHSKNGPRKRSFELILSSTLLFQTFEDIDRPVTVTGRLCRDRLEAMQRVAEHEFTHLVEMLIWNAGNCSQPRFQSIAKNNFAHTDFQHDLITQRERAVRKFDVRLGDMVVFKHEGHVLRGRVNRITRRATVLVLDPQGQRFTDGHHYSRYYVPLEKLRKA